MYLGFKPFRATNVSVTCDDNIVPIAEVTIEGSITDISPRGITRLTDVIERAANGRGGCLNISIMQIKNVIFNNPATIVFWEDGTKTVVKCQDGDIYDPEKGLAMAISKKALGNQGNYCEVFKKWLPEEEENVGEFEFTFEPIDVSKILGKVEFPNLGSFSIKKGE